jgi:hypothetical protein
MKTLEIVIQLSESVYLQQIPQRIVVQRMPKTHYGDGDSDYGMVQCYAHIVEESSGRHKSHHENNPCVTEIDDYAYGFPIDIAKPCRKRKTFF